MAAGVTSSFNQRLKLRKAVGAVFYVLFLTAILIGIIGLMTLLIRVLVQGLPWLDWHFISSYPSRFPEQAGFLAAIAGSAWVMGLVGLFTVPVGVGAAIYLEEYAPKNWFTRFIEVNIANLAGVPSVVYGLMGFALFVTALSLGRVVLAGALTLTLLVLPIVVLASREAIRAVPNTYREAAYGLGATKFQVVKGVIIPQATPGIMTGTILALSRAIGEAAPVIIISALVFLRFVPTDPLDRFTVMPIQIYNWVQRPQDGFREIAAAGIIVLLVVLLSMNAIAVYIRNRTQVKSEE